nr:MAG TPA: hypothetical protein [Herelleviridae sp.]
MNNEFHFFCYLGLSFCLFVRIGKKICTFRRNIRFVIILLFWCPVRS